MDDCWQALALEEPFHGYVKGRMVGSVGARRDGADDDRVGALSQIGYGPRAGKGRREHQ
jgi:hypothetical protein